MRWGPLAVALLAVAAAAQNTAFDPSGVRVYYSPENLWRDGHGDFLGRREGKDLVLVYDFFGSEGEGGTYSACPPNRGDPKVAPDCEAVHAAVSEALALWSQASGKLILRRRRSSEPVNIWIAWTNAFPDEYPPVAKSFDNSRDARQPDRDDADQGFAGFDRIGYPGSKKAFGALLFNDKYCWFLDESACPAPVRLDNGKVMSNNRSIRLVSLHEVGHVLGFGHFTVASIMGQAGGTSRYELTPYDREAVRRLYARVDASVPFQ